MDPRLPDFGKPSPGFEPDNERRAAARSRWQVRVTRRGRVLTVIMHAPTETIAALSEQELLAAAWAYARGRPSKT